ncbi:hypothetical protein N7468_008622 [Penicillium chermesinum]|uniref:Uncharacterized protein n=1 Tax=Penicillium chermesinum TaxID=63820 RepID=A0A9W9NQ25_9EURO|nr:uncharacterized protein N7468_008622 [Penicillium chermesinum]KAJ5224080.1 hypothetical protein N7468_008622 [Penicillium chermesinum]
MAYYEPAESFIDALFGRPRSADGKLPQAWPVRVDMRAVLTGHLLAPDPSIGAKGREVTLSSSYFPMARVY